MNRLAKTKNISTCRAESVTLVLGMHRSGTSCLTGSLQEAGLQLGSVITSAPHNRKGNRENPDIMRLNEDVLQANGGAWDNPPATVSWSDEQFARRDQILTGCPASPNWGFKDPRTLFTLDGWRYAVAGLQMVASVRHPASVAQSLTKRNGFSTEFGLELWYLYNARLLDLLNEDRFPVVNFDLPPEQYLQQVDKVATNLRLPGPPGGYRFFENSLRSNSNVLSIELPAKISRLYAQLIEHTSRP